MTNTGVSFCIAPRELYGSRDGLSQRTQNRRNSANSAEKGHSLLPLTATAAVPAQAMEIKASAKVAMRDEV